jgi:predicted Fe-Mo cluster-binding NifX family protein
MTTPTTAPKQNSIRLAIPVADGRLHGHFGGCREFALIQVDPDQKLTLRTDVLPAPEHQPGAFPRWLREQGVAVVIAGGIGKRALANFAQHGITVRAGLADASVEQLVAAYLDGQLTATPDGCEHHGHHHDHEHGHHHHHDHHHGDHHHHAEGQT